MNRVLNEVKSSVDGVIGFPADIEKPIVAAFSPSSTVMSLALTADTDAGSLKELAEELRLELTDLDEISRVDVNYVRPYEIAVEISEFTLRQYNLTLNQVATAINNSAMDMPAGTLRTTGGDILLRTKGRMATGNEYENIIVRSYPDGSQLRLADIATVKDGFDLMKASMDAVHAMVLADILAEVDQATGNDLQAQFLKNLTLDGIGQRFAMLLTAARQHEKFTFIGPYPDH